MSTLRFVSCLALCTVMAISGCVSSLAPTVFRVSQRQDVIPALQRALAQRGVTPDRIDEVAGVVLMPWENTGTNTDGTIWAARYIITVAPVGNASDISVQMDLRTCEAGFGVDPRSGRVDGSSCARLPEGTTPEMYQSQLDEFASSLREAMGGDAVTSGS